MPNRCVAGGCGNSPNLKKGIALHFIPFKDDDRPQARKKKKKKKEVVDFVKLKQPSRHRLRTRRFVPNILPQRIL